jgi:RND family efflux transporter MFP subunit
MSKTQKTWIVVGAVLVVIIGAVLVFANLRVQGNVSSSGTAGSSNGTAGGSGTSAYQTTTVQQGTLTSTVEGTGTVGSSLSANLTWLSSGQVDKVNAKIGDQVKTGDVLATLVQDSTQIALESALITAQQNLAELTSPEAIANARLAITTAQTNVTNAQLALSNLKYWQNTALIQNYYANMVLAKSNLDKAQTAYDNAKGGQYINNSNQAAAYNTLYTAQVAYNNAQYYYSLYSQAPTQNQQDQAQANLDLANATLKSAQVYLEALAGGTVPANASGTALLQLKQDQLAVQTAQANLNAAELTAPFSGTITQSNAFPNAVVTLGTQAFRIDDLSSLNIVVQVVEVDIDNVKIGQPAQITFDAIPNKTYAGKVISTDLAGTASQSSVNFNITIQITNADAQVKPGMSANVTVITNKVANAILVPNTSVFTDTNGGQYVYLVQNGSTSKVPVTVGAISDSVTQITSGNLKAGDTIVLSFASTSTTGGLGAFRLGGGGGGAVTAGARPVTTP